MASTSATVAASLSVPVLVLAGRPEVSFAITVAADVPVPISVAAAIAVRRLFARKGVGLEEVTLAGDGGGLAALDGVALPLRLADENWFCQIYSVDGACHGSTVPLRCGGSDRREDSADFRALDALYYIGYRK